MKKSLLLLLLIIGTMFAGDAFAQKTKEKPKAKAYAPIKIRSDEELRSWTDDDLDPEMSREQLVEHITEAINNRLRSAPFVQNIVGNNIDIVDDDGDVYHRTFFTTVMTEKMIKGYSFRIHLKKTDVINVAGFYKSGDDLEMGWKPRGPYVIDGKIEDLMGFSIGEFYRITSMKAYKLGYQMEYCLNAAKKLFIPSRKRPQLPPPKPEKTGGERLTQTQTQNININIYPRNNHTVVDNGDGNIDIIDTVDDDGIVKGKCEPCPNKGKTSKTKRRLRGEDADNRFCNLWHIFWHKTEHHHSIIDKTCKSSLVRVDTVNRPNVLPPLIIALFAFGEDYACTQNYWRGRDHNQPTPEPDPGQTTTGIPTGPGHKTGHKQSQEPTTELHLYRFPKGNTYENRIAVKKPIAAVQTAKPLPKINLGLTYKVTLTFPLGTKQSFADVLMAGLSSLKFSPTFLQK